MMAMTDSVMASSIAVIPVRIIPLARDARYIPPARLAGRITRVRVRAFHRDPLSMIRYVPFVAVAFAACSSSAPRPAPSVPVASPVPTDTAKPVPPPPAEPAFAPLPLITWGPLPPGEQRELGEPSIDLRHQTVRLRFDWNRRAVVASTTLQIAPASGRGPLRELALDAVDLRIHRVVHRDSSLGFRHDGPIVRIALGDRAVGDTLVEVTIEYEAVRPERGVHFVDRKKVVWAQGFARDTRYWIPTVDRPDDKTTWEFFIRAPSGERALSNGRLVRSRELPGGEVEWHWRLEHPASTYLMSVVTGDYIVLRDRWRDTPLGYWTYRDSIEATWRGFARTPRAIDFFSEWTGLRYPWTKYDQIVAPDFVFGGMENVTAVTMSDDAILHPAWAEPRSSADGLVAHELAHMWFGDYVTMRNWDDAWLSEGFATFLSTLFIERIRGRADGAMQRRGAHEQTIAADRRNRRPLVYGRWVSDPAEVYFSGHIYPRGASVLQMLRRNLGDSTLRAGLSRYLQMHAYGSATSADLRQALEQAAGRDLSRFFSQWVYGAGVPAFRVSWKFDTTRAELDLTAIQVQPRDDLTGLFEADVDVEVQTDSGVVRQVIAVRGERTTTAIPLRAAPRSIRWDAGDWLLDVSDFPRPTDMLTYQLAHDADPLGRVEAIDALAPRIARDEPARRAVVHAARTDSLWMVRERAVNALATVVEDDSARRVVLAATRDSDTRVREAAAGALARAAGDTTVIERLRDMARGERSWWVRGAAMRALVTVDSMVALDAARDMVRRTEWRDLARIAALESLARINAPEARALIVEHLDQGARPGRVAAINALVAQASSSDTSAARMLEPLLGDDDLFIRSAAAGALGRIGARNSVTALRARRTVEEEPRVRTAIDQAIRRIGS
jgi:aminopeptidase N